MSPLPSSSSPSNRCAWCTRLKVLFQELLTAMNDARFIERCCIISSATLIWYDFALTFAEEVQRMWTRRLTGATFSYYCIRYSMLIDRIIILSELMRYNNDKSCSVLTHVDDMLYLINYLGVAAFTNLRLYGISAKDWKFLLVVGPLTLTIPVILLVETASYTAYQAGPSIGCQYDYQYSSQIVTHLTTATVSTAIAANAILVIVTWVKTFSIVKVSIQFHVRTSLARVLMRDGTLYFMLLLLNAVLQLYPNSKATLFVVWPYFCEVFTAIILSRFMLNLRGIYFTDSYSGDSVDAGTLSFRGLPGFRVTSSNVVGNLGATVRTRPHSHYQVPAQYEQEHEGEEAEFSDDPFREGMLEGALVTEGELMAGISMNGALSL